MIRYARAAVVALLLVALWATPALANRKFTSGFELQSTTNHVEWSTTDTPNTAGTISTSVFRSGAAAYCVASPSSGVAKGQATRFAGTTTDGVDYFARTYFRVGTLPNVSTSFLGFGASEQALHARVYLNATGTLSVQVDGDTVVGPGSTTLNTGGWYQIELRLRRHATTPNMGADQVEVRIEGVQELVSTTQSVATTGHNRVHIGVNLRGANDLATSGDWCFDDVAVNDSVDAGAGAQISWPGAGSVVTLFPNAPGEFGQDVTNTGDTPAASFWESLDDGAATGTVDTTDHVTFDAATTNWTGTGDRLAVAMGAMPDATSVTLVATGLRWANLSGSNSSYATSIQIANGGTKPTDTTITITHATLWLLNSITSARAETMPSPPGTTNIAPVYYTNPSGSAWSEADVNNLQVLLRAVDHDPAILITSLWAHVEYTPDAGGDPPAGDGAGLLLLRVQ